jgi:hypothetical protein
MACRRCKEQRTSTVFGDNVYERTVPDGHLLTAIALNLKRMVEVLTAVSFGVEAMATDLAQGTVRRQSATRAGTTVGTAFRTDKRQRRKKKHLTRR